MLLLLENSVRLSTIHEGRTYLDSEMIGERPVLVLDDPSPPAVLSMARKASGVLGGWISNYGIYVWDYSYASHDHIARSFKLDIYSFNDRAMAFYMNPVKNEYNNIVDMGFDIGYAGVESSIDQLMSHPFIVNLVNYISNLKGEDKTCDYQ